MTKNHQWLLTSMAILMAAAGLIFLTHATTDQPDPALALAVCLTEKNVTMYGVDTCAACQNQKKNFGAAFTTIDYVNCAFHAADCNALPSTGYPTWTMRGRVIAEGLISLPDLAQRTSCPFEKIP